MDWGLSGYISKDTISIGNITVTEQPFIVASHDDRRASLKSDGLMGLGFEDLSSAASIVSMLKSEGKITHRQFALHLSENRDESDLAHKHSSLMIDGYDLDKYSSEDNFTYVDLVPSTSSWEIPCEAVFFHHKLLTGGVSAIIDTSISYIIGPQTDIVHILQTLEDDYDCDYDDSDDLKCNCNDTFPDIKFSFSKKMITLTSDDYFYIDEWDCYPTFRYDSNINYWILGDNFVRRFYMNFDMDNKRIGFAKSKKSDDGWPDWLYAVVVIGAVIGFALVCYILAAIAFLVLRCLTNSKTLDLKW